jgi:hypothetical protein
MSDKLLYYVNKFNNGEWDEFSNIFNGEVKPFLTLLNRRGMLDMIDLKSIWNEDEYILNEVMLDLLELNNEEYFNKFVQEFISDVEIRSDGYYLRLSDVTELAEFFKGDPYSRNYDPRKVVENVLGEDWWEPFSDTIHNVYDDIINVLSDKNLQELATRVLELVGNQELSLDDYSSELFEDMSDDNGNFIITESNIQDVIGDKDSMEQLFGGELNDLSNELHWLGDSAYNQDYNDMIYRQVWDSLSTLFEGTLLWEERKRDGNKNIHIPYVKIKNLYQDIKEFLYSFKGYTDTLYDYSNYTDLKGHYMDDKDEWLDLGRLDDYPDHRKVDEYINDGFTDRLYS